MGNALRCLEGFSLTMGNALSLRCLEGGEDHGGRDHYPYYRPTSGSTYVLQSGTVDEPAAAQQIPVGTHGLTVPTAGVAHLDQDIHNFKTTSMDPLPNLIYLQGGIEVQHGKRVVAPRHQFNDIDESSAVGLCDAASYAKANVMLIQIQVLGTAKTFWRLSDDATSISRKLALILWSHHSVGKYLAAPLQVSNVWISTAGTGNVKLRGARFTTGRHFSVARFRYDYKLLSRVLLEIIRMSGANITKLPPDYKEFLVLLESDTITMKDEFLIVNNPALLPMSNRTEVFLMLYDKIVTCLARTKAGKAKKKRILSKLPYENDWLDTAVANKQIKKWVDNVKMKYNTTQLDQLRLNRNVRSHLHQYNDENIEEVLYCEWPELLMDMAKMLHMEGELQGTHIQNKFGYTACSVAQEKKPNHCSSRSRNKPKHCSNNWKKPKHCSLAGSS